MLSDPALYKLGGIDPLDRDRALVAAGGLAQFVQLTWHLVETAPLVWGPHLELMCAHYEAVSRGECRELVVNVPPGCSKSTITNVFWPAWDWIKYGWRKWMFTSYDKGLTLRDAGRCATIVQSEWYQRRFGEQADPTALSKWGWQPFALRQRAKGKVAAGLYYTNQGGMRMSTMFGGNATGYHCHFLVADDPIKPAEIQNGGDQARAALEKVNTRWMQTFSSRSADPDTFARVIIMQRLHENDLAGMAIQQGACLLRLPMEYEPNAHCATPWGEDWRSVEGELLAPGRFSRETVNKRKGSAGVPGLPARDWAAQYQQRPSPEAGAIFQRAWFVHRWSALPAGTTLIQSWDCAFKGESTSDMVVGQVWGKLGARYFVCDQIRARMEITGTCQAMRDLSAKWPGARTKLIEDKANGPAVEQTLRHVLPGIQLVTPMGGKVARANAVEPYWRAGNVALAEGAHWLGEFTEEHVRFPVAANDDQVDAGTQALIFFEGKGGSYAKLKRAMANASKAA